MQKHISSLQNPLVKQLVQLIEKSRERKKTGLFVIEGQREIQLAIKGGYVLKTVLICRDIFSGDTENFVTMNSEVIELSLEVYQKLAYRGTTEGIIAIAESRVNQLKALQFITENPLILVAEAPEKPGNIGALLRTADAAGVDAVILANPKTDLYNPNIIRSSVGGIFTKRIATGSTSEILHYLKEKNIAIYCAALQSSKPYHTIDLTQACAIIVGTEATGLSEEWLQQSTQNIVIPMQGEIDSMNVSVAAGILIFEAKRQRGFV
ncbi:TrmH family RNA methyltransferase [Constantimarinum furrinae]|uniref:rRNA methyltransferase n=1 Tax=Constantimarinum furrinae TaxID=2562285 RepID=A0A7G8PVL5_9FLAO|nr:RNA methyltransferase [Constantimarinum furrinae]QNJ98381.1 rRNA methyltransferase [Constantimarinum furrinae]